MLDTASVKLGSLSGEVVSLGDLLKPDMINMLIFYNTNCLGCTGRALPHAYDLSLNEEKINLIVIHVSFGTRIFEKEEILSVFTDQNAPFPIYLDEKAELFNEMACEGTPHWIFLSKEGNVQHSIFGSQDGAKIKIQYAIEELKQSTSV